jgi:hypothetical protein
VFLDGIGDFGGPALDLLLILALEHDPQQRLGSGLANEETAIARQAPLDAIHRLGNRGHAS